MMDDLPKAADFVCKGVIDALKAQRQWDMATGLSNKGSP